MGKAVIVQLPLQITDLDKYLTEQTRYFKELYRESLTKRVRNLVDSLIANGTQWKSVWAEAHAVLTRDGHMVKSEHSVKRIYFGKHSKNHSRK